MSPPSILAHFPRRYNYGKASLSFSHLLEGLMGRDKDVNECGLVSELFADLVHPSKVGSGVGRGVEGKCGVGVEVQYWAVPCMGNCISHLAKLLLTLLPATTNLQPLAVGPGAAHGPHGDVHGQGRGPHRWEPN